MANSKNHKLTFSTLSLNVLSLSLLILTFQSSPSFANRLDQRQDKQEQRIQQGIDKGQLNQNEANRFQNQQNRIQNKEDKFASDGEITRKEKVKLNKMQNKTSRHIFRQKHDKQKAN